ncbi:MAG: peptidase MA family metallohydrolase [Desulfuromonadales bacterium]|nr:peptidase MA family metallohydrolase [Desulfuromonadales bacterium]
MMSLPELMKFYQREGAYRFSSGTCLLLLFLMLVMPATSTASTNQKIEEAVHLLQQKEYTQALDLLHDLETSLLNPGQISNLLGIAYLGRGYQLLSSGDFSKAREAFMEGRRYNEGDMHLWQGEAMTLFRQGRYAEAVSLLDQALGIAPHNAEIYHLLGKSYYADGRMAEALDALTSSIEQGGGSEITSFREKVLREWQVEQEMRQQVRGHFQLSFVDGGQSDTLATAILETLEDAFTELGSDLAYYPDVRVPVLLYSHNDFSAVTNSPDWAGALYDGKIRLPLGGMSEMTEQLAALLYHEYMHVLLRFLVKQHIPVWLNEGLAELAGRRVHSLSLRQLQKATKENRLIPWHDLAVPFTGLADDNVPLAYEQSYSLVVFLVDRFGWHKIKELLERLGQRQEWQTAIAGTYRDYGLDWPAILTEWQASLTQ